MFDQGVVGGWSSNEEGDDAILHEREKRLSPFSCRAECLPRPAKTAESLPRNP